MKTFSALLAFCAGNSPVTGEFPTQRPVTRSFDIFFDLCLNKGWVNNRDAGDLRRHRVHYDVIVMSEFPLTRSPLDPADPAGPGLPRCPCEKKKKQPSWRHGMETLFGTDCSLFEIWYPIALIMTLL